MSRSNYNLKKCIHFSYFNKEKKKQPTKNSGWTAVLSSQGGPQVATASIAGGNTNQQGPKKKKKIILSSECPHSFWLDRRALAFSTCNLMKSRLGTCGPLFPQQFTGLPALSPPLSAYGSAFMSLSANGEGPQISHFNIKALNTRTMIACRWRDPRRLLSRGRIWRKWLSFLSDTLQLQASVVGRARKAHVTEDYFGVRSNFPSNYAGLFGLC